VTPTIGLLLAEARTRLAATSFGAPSREAAVLLGRVLGLSEAQVMAREEAPVEEEVAARFRGLLSRRLVGEPVAYLLGEREFYGRPFRVDRRVLIPRPETEHVVEVALALPLPRRPLVLDVGTGSGCLAITLAAEIPGARSVATDLSPGALAVAAGNAQLNGVASRVFPMACDLASALALGRFDLVVSNPPYVDRADARLLSPEVRDFEPHLALFSPGAGDSTLARLFAQCGGQEGGMTRGAQLVVEIGAGQLDTARRHAAAAGRTIITVQPDLAGIPRVLAFTRG
jgi:release factor glutamine methyltransferase